MTLNNTITQEESSIEICYICNKPAIKYKQTLSRWFNDQNKEVIAHSECDLDQQQRESDKRHEQHMLKLKNGSDTAILAANEIERLSLNIRALEFAEYMAKKAEQYIEEYNFLEEERLSQKFNNKQDTEKLFQMEQDLGEIETQLKIYIYEFRKRNTFPA